jgi:hypothetical protein
MPECMRNRASTAKDKSREGQFLRALETAMQTEPHEITIELGNFNIIHKCLSKHMMTANSVLEGPYSLGKLGELMNNIENCMNDLILSDFVMELCPRFAEVLEILSDADAILYYGKGD